MIAYNEIRINSSLKSGEKIAIALLSDLHVDSAKFDQKQLAAKLEGVDYALIFGDVADWITHKDDRYLPENGIDVGDAFISDALKYVETVLRTIGPKILFLAHGNHETSIIKLHGIDPMRELGRRLGCQVGAYTGTVDLLVGVTGGRSARLRIGYHHGRWGGFNDKGYSGAKRFFDAFEGYDVFCYGHNHASRCDVVRRIVLAGTKYATRDVIFVNCSCQVSPLNGGSLASYEIVHGHQLQPQVVNVLGVEARCVQGNWSLRKRLEIVL